MEANIVENKRGLLYISWKIRHGDEDGHFRPKQRKRN